ncbi:MAG: ABC transporter permease subunit [Butyricimonas faecihominis]
MNMIYKIAKTELQMLFYSPVAWLVLIIFTFQSGMIFWMIEMIEREQAMGYDTIFISSSLFNRLFYSIQDYLFLYIPLLTMGLVSRDLAGGTIKLLHSSPMTNTQIILGKFLSMMIFALLLVGIFVRLRDLLPVRGGEFRCVLYSYGDLGIYLLICTYASIGLFMSTISSYQIIAAVGTFVLLTFLNFVNGIWQDIDFVRDITFWLSLRGRAESFTGGLISSEDMIYFIMVPGMFLWFSIIKLSSRVSHASKGRNAMKYVGVFFVVAVVGYLSSRPHLMGYVDTTREKSRTFTPNSQEIVKKLEGGLTITTYSNLLDDDFMKAIPRYQNYDKGNFREYVRFKPEIKMEYAYISTTRFKTRGEGDFWLIFLWKKGPGRLLTPTKSSFRGI